MGEPKIDLKKLIQPCNACNTCFIGCTTKYAICTTISAICTTICALYTTIFLVVYSNGGSNSIQLLYTHINLNVQHFEDQIS